jgi:hypothetical protein
MVLSASDFPSCLQEGGDEDQTLAVRVKSRCGP